MVFSNQFLVENSIPLSFIDSLNLFQNYGQSPPLLPDKAKFEAIIYFSERIFELFHSDIAMKNLTFTWIIFTVDGLAH